MSAEEAPPPYEKVPSGNPAPANANPPPANAGPSGPQGQVARQFPPIFNVYSQSFSRTFLLGEHQNQPFYAMSIHSGLSSSPSIVLHSGPSNTHPPLASVEFHSFSSSMSITLPPAPRGSPHAGSALEVELESRAGFPTYSYVFSMGVGPNCERLEQFEWRTSSGEAIGILDGRSRGHKLVRLSWTVPANAPPGVIRGGDGKEVVAAWTNAHMSMSKAAIFGFMGSGLAGELGERWAIMAVISGLAIFERERQRRRRNASS